MTFIAAVTSPRFAYLSGDLRVTTEEGNAVSDQSDWAMKAMLLGADEIFGFTGLARIGDQLTDQWLAESLASVGATDRLETLAKAATIAFKRLDLRQPQAFLGVGFHQVNRRRIPHAWIVTNSWDDVELRFDPRLRDSRFGLHFLPADRARLTSMWTVGGEDETGEVTHPAVHEAYQEIEELVQRDISNPLPVMNRLADLNEQMSSLGGYIGASAVVTSLPRNAVREAGAFVWIGGDPNLQSLSRYPFSVNYVRDFRGPHREHWRQPGLISESGVSVVGAVSANQASSIGPDPHRGHAGSAFGL